MALALYTGTAPDPGATITVRHAGTLDRAVIFEDEIGTLLGNPFTANELDGSWQFYADDGQAYDIIES